MFLLLLTRFRVQQNVIHPAAILVSPQQVVAVEIPGGVHSKAWISSPKIRVVMGYGVAALIDDERVPLPVNALRRAVVFHGLLQAQGGVQVDGLLDEGLGVGGGVGCTWPGLVPPRPEDQPLMPYHPGVLGLHVA